MADEVRLRVDGLMFDSAGIPYTMNVKHKCLFIIKLDFDYHSTGLIDGSMMLKVYNWFDESGRELEGT